MKNIVVVVTDLGTFKAYKLEHTPRNTPRLVLLQEKVLAEAHQKLLDQLSDSAGRYHAPTHGKWGTTWGDRHNLELEQKRRLIRQLARHLESVLHNGGIEGCYLAAGKDINHQVLDALEPRCRQKIVKNLPADLTKLDKAALLERFQAGGERDGRPGRPMPPPRPQPQRRP